MKSVTDEQWKRSVIQGDFKAAWIRLSLEINRQKYGQLISLAPVLRGKSIYTFL